MSKTLDQRLLDAHSRDDRTALVTLYHEAAQVASDTAQYFYLTHAYIFALETGHPLTSKLYNELKAAGRET